MASETNRRKKLLINPEFQVKFIKNLILLNLGVCGIFYGAQSYFFWESRQLGRSIALAPDHVFFRFIDEQQRSMNLITVSTVLLVSLVIFGFGLVYSHRIAGPIYRLHKYFKGRANGTETDPLKFRQDDYFQEICESVNHYIEKKEVKTRSNNNKAA